jgi:hypothetical protein
LEIIGSILEQVVREVEVTITVAANEDMHTVICKVPLFVPDKTGLRAPLNELNRALQDSRRGRYRYKGGGKCRRCLIKKQ